MPELWEQREDETSKSYNAFKEYLLLGHKRSFEKLARRLGNSSLNHIRVWSVKYQWQDRAKAFDAYKVKKSIDETLNQSIEISSDALNFIQLLFKMLINKATNADSKKEFLNLSPDKLSFIASSFIKHIPSIVELKHNALNELILSLGLDNERGVNFLEQIKNDDNAREQFNKFIDSISGNS